MNSQFNYMSFIIGNTLFNRFIFEGLLLTRTRSHQNFEELLYEAVDEGLSSIGESAKQAIYYYLEESSHINRQEIPYKVEDFAAAIEKIFGLGTNFLQIIILKQLYEKIGESFDLPASDDLNFIKCVKRARKAMSHEPKQLEIEI